MQWWLSFADPDRPMGHTFLGVVIVEAASFKDAVTKSWKLKCNPGGECMGYELPDKLPTKFLNRLLSSEELEYEDIGERVKL